MKNSTTNHDKDSVALVRSQLELFRRTHPEFKLPPPPPFEHQLGGWLREAIKRANIRSQRLTALEHTLLAMQFNALYDQITALAEKEYTASRLPCRAAISDVKLMQEASQAHLALERSQRQREKEAIQDQLELERLRRTAEREKEEHRLAVIKTCGEGLRVRKETELRAIQADQEIDDLLFPRVKESEHTRREGQLKKEIDRIVAEVDSVVELTQQCSEMEKRYPEAHRPLIKRLFRKAIDRRMEAL